MLLSRGHEAAHLAGIEQAVGIDLVLEAELVDIDALVAAAILDGEDVGIGDIDPVLLVQPDDLVQSIRDWCSAPPAGRCR